MVLSYHPTQRIKTFFVLVNPFSVKHHIADNPLLLSSHIKYLSNFKSSKTFRLYIFFYFLYLWANIINNKLDFQLNSTHLQQHYPNFLLIIFRYIQFNSSGSYFINYFHQHFNIKSRNFFILFFLIQLNIKTELLYSKFEQANRILSVVSLFHCVMFPFYFIYVLSLSLFLFIDFFVKFLFYLIVKVIIFLDSDFNSI